MLTTAKLSFSYSGIDYTKLNFFGNDAELWQTRWKKVEAERYTRYNELMDSCQSEINAIDKEVEVLNRELNSYKRWYKFWKTKAEKEIYNKIKIKKNKIKNLSHEYNRLKDNMFYTSKELTVKAKQFLAENGFKKIDAEVYNTRYTETYSF